MLKDPIPRKTVYRLSIYHRCLQRLKANKVQTVSSEALAKAAGSKSSQLRKDLAHFGHFGTRGIGYDVDLLGRKLTDVLGTTRLQPVILVGVGDLGSALFRYGGFAKEGFEIVRAFDAAPLRPRSSDIKIYPMTQLRAFVAKNVVKMAILAVPGTTAQEVANELVASGIHAILNFAPIILQVPEEVVVNNVDLALELENLSYFMR